MSMLYSTAPSLATIASAGLLNEEESIGGFALRCKHPCITSSRSDGSLATQPAIFLAPESHLHNRGS